MGTNYQLEVINEYMPTYEECKNEVFEHFVMFRQLKAVNYAALGQRTGFQGPPVEIVGVFLAGLALGRAQELSEQGHGEYWYPLAACSLVEDELEAIRPDTITPPVPDKK